MSWSWAKFTQNGMALVVPVIGYVVADRRDRRRGHRARLELGDHHDHHIHRRLRHHHRTDDRVRWAPLASSPSWSGYLLLFAVAIYMHAGIVSGTLDIADGKPVTIATFFKPRNLGGVVLTALLVAAGHRRRFRWRASSPGIIFGFLAQFAIHFVVDRSQSPVDAMKGSIATTRSDIGGSLLSWLVQYAAMLIGEVLCVVGLFVAFPVALLLQTYTYRKLSGGQVVALDQPGYPQGPPAGIRRGHCPHSQPVRQTGGASRQVGPRGLG